MPKQKSHLIKVQINSVNKRCKVSREFILVQPGDRVSFRNQTSDDAHIHVSEDKLFKNPQFRIVPGGEKTVEVRKVQCGIYPYAVYCDCSRKFCTGSSMPIIIIPRHFSF